MTLGSWFRDYVYIPLGGNRVGKLRLLFNIFAVWFLTGFWHGAEWNFIVWGIYFGVLLTLEKLWLKKYIEKSKVLGHIYTLLLVSVSFAIFSGGSMKEALSVVGGMFGIGKLPMVSDSFLYALRNYGWIFMIAAVSATPLPVLFLKKCTEKKGLSSLWKGLEILLMVAVLILATAYLADGAFNPFLYFRF